MCDRVAVHHNIYIKRATHSQTNHLTFIECGGLLWWLYSFSSNASNVWALFVKTGSCPRVRDRSNSPHFLNVYPNLNVRRRFRGEDRLAIAQEHTHTHIWRVVHQTNSTHTHFTRESDPQNDRRHVFIIIVQRHCGCCCDFGGAGSSSAASLHAFVDHQCHAVVVG